MKACSEAFQQKKFPIGHFSDTILYHQVNVYRNSSYLLNKRFQLQLDSVDAFAECYVLISTIRMQLLKGDVVYETKKDTLFVRGANYADLLNQVHNGAIKTVINTFDNIHLFTLTERKLMPFDTNLIEFKPAGKIGSSLLRYRDQLISLHELGYGDSFILSNIRVNKLHQFKPSSLSIYQSDILLLNVVHLQQAQFIHQHDEHNHHDSHKHSDDISSAPNQSTIFQEACFAHSLGFDLCFKSN